MQHHGSRPAHTGWPRDLSAAALTRKEKVQPVAKLYAASLFATRHAAEHLAGLLDEAGRARAGLRRQLAEGGVQAIEGVLGDDERGQDRVDRHRLVYTRFGP